MTTQRLTFPGSTDPASVVAALRSLVSFSGGRAGWRQRPICLETWASAGSISHLVTTSDRAVVAALNAALPGLRIEKARRPTDGLAGAAAGASIRGPAHGLIRIDIQAEVAASVLAGLTGLGQGETAVLQWLVVPLKRRRLLPVHHPRDHDPERRAKESETEVVAVGRIAAWAFSPGRAGQLTQQVARALVQASGAGAGLTVRRSQRVPARVLAQRPPWPIWPSHLNLAELAGVVGWPIGAGVTPGLSRGACRQLPLPVGWPDSGPVLGSSNYPGSDRTLRLGTNGRLRHLHVIGPTGVGKSTLLVHLIAQDLRAGRGLVVFDPIGDLAAAVAERTPPDRLGDIVVVDPTETKRPVGFNLLAGPDPQRLVEFTLAVFARLFASSWGPRTADILRASLLTLSAQPGATLNDLPELLTNSGYRRRLVAPVMDQRLLAGFWTWYEDLSAAERSAAIAPVLNKVRSFLLRPAVTRTLCHAEGTLEFGQVLSHRRVVIVRLAKGLIGEDTASLIGGLLLARLWQSVLARAAVEPPRRPVFIYLDEFQDYLRLPVGLGDMLAQARGLGVGVVMAHQHLRQLPEAVRADVLANVGSRVIFQPGADDARVLARDLQPHLTDADLKGLGAREIVATVATADRRLPPATGTTLPPDPSLHPAEKVLTASRASFGRPLPDSPARIELAESPVGRRRRAGSQP